MAAILQCVSPVDGRVYVERPLADAVAIDAAGTASGNTITFNQPIWII